MKNHTTTKMRRIIYILFCLLFSGISLAQNPTPAPAQSKRILYIGGKAHVGNGAVIEQSAVAFTNGKFVFVQSSVGFKAAREAYDTIINIDGKHIYPGIIAMNSNIGLREMELVRATNDYTEIGKINPSVRAVVAYNTDSKVIPTLRSNGVLMAQIAPEGGMVSGMSSVVQLDAWNWEDAAYKIDEGMFMSWPSMRIFKGRTPAEEEEQRERNEKQMRELESLFRDAKAYSLQTSTNTVNQHFEAMRGLFTGSRKLYIRTDYIREITAAVQFCKLYGIKMVLVGGADSWKMTNLLTENNVSVIITRTQELPRREDDDVYLPYKLPALLYKAGVRFCITDNGYWQQRNIAFEAGTAVGFGLPYEEAIKAITQAPAEILGISSSCGTLEDSKDATFIITSGDLLDMKSSVVEEAYIQGRKIDLDNIQHQLFLKYKNKYGITE